MFNFEKSHTFYVVDERSCEKVNNSNLEYIKSKQMEGENYE